MIRVFWASWMSILVRKQALESIRLINTRLESLKLNARLWLIPTRNHVIVYHTRHSQMSILLGVHFEEHIHADARQVYIRVK
jgi:hypothetical protein